MVPEYAAPSIEDPPKNDRKPAIDETADFEQNANTNHGNSEQWSNNQQRVRSDTRYGRVVQGVFYVWLFELLSLHYFQSLVKCKALDIFAWYCQASQYLQLAVDLILLFFLFDKRKQGDVTILQ